MAQKDNERASKCILFSKKVTSQRFDQAKYNNYLDNHKMQLINLVQSRPNWIMYRVLQMRFHFLNSLSYISVNNCVI